MRTARIGPPELIENLDRARLPFNVNVVAQEAAITALDQQDHVRKSAQLAREETRFLSEELGKRGWKVEPTATNFVFAEAPGSGTPLVDALLRRGIILRPLTAFGLSDRFFRISHGTHPQNEMFLDALDHFVAETDAW